MRRHHLWLGAVLLTALLVSTPAVRADEPKPLPQDPSFEDGRLDNGLRYLLKRHGNPEGRISLVLHIATGSLNETEKQRGIAHFLEHLAFNGSKNFPPGKAIEFFESLGLTFGQHQNAMTSFNATAYLLSLPDCKAETVAKGLLFLSDVGLRLSLLPEEIESERGVILEEKRTRAGASQRIQEYIFERLAPESIFGRRSPIGTEETIQGMQVKDFRDYYSKWYVPSNMTLVAVGDCDMAPVAEAIERAFADGPTVPRPTPQPVGVKPATTTRAIVASDPELTSASLSIMRIGPPRGAARTDADFRAELVEQIGTWIFNRRMSAIVAEGKVAFRRGSAAIQDLAGTIRVVAVDASGKPDKWQAMLADLARVLQQARRHGFTEREVADARTEILAGAERRIRVAASTPAMRLVFRIGFGLSSGEPLLSPQQSRDLTAKLLPGIEAEEVSDVFREAFDPTHVTFAARLPAGEGVPTEAELIEAGRKALAVEAEKQAEGARIEKLMDPPLVPETVWAASTHEASGVWSARMDNGARAHHRFNDQRKNHVTVQITLAGGEIEETAENRGITAAAMLAWSRPATRKLSSTQIREFMTGKQVQVGGGADHDALTLSVSGDPKDLETGMQLAHLLLTEPVIEKVALDQWKERRRQALAGRRMRVGAVLQEAVARTLYPKVAAMQPIEEADLAKITLEDAQGWLERGIKTAPIEVAVVGDIDRKAAGALLVKYVNSLPKRPWIGVETLAELRKVERPKGPLDIKCSVETQTPQAMVLDGFFGVDRGNTDDVRRLFLASRILSTRMLETLREEKRLVYAIMAGSRPAQAYPGYGMFVAQAPTDPARAIVLGAAIDEMYGAFKKEGPTEEEMAVAKKQMANMLDEGRKTPEFWLTVLGDLDYRGRSLDNVMGSRAAYEALTAEEVREAFGRYYVPESRFRFVVVPAVPAVPEKKEGG